MHERKIKSRNWLKSEVLGRCKNARNLQKQKVYTKELSMLRGFKGHARNILAYTVRKTLPLEEFNTDIEPSTFYINDTHCIAFF